MNLIHAQQNPIDHGSINCEFEDEYVQGFFIYFECNPTENLDYFYVELSQKNNIFFEDRITDITDYNIITSQKTPLGDITIQIFALDKETNNKFIQESIIFLKKHTDDMIWAELVDPNRHSYYIIPDFLKNNSMDFITFLLIITGFTLIGFVVVMLFYNRIYQTETRSNEAI